MSVTLSHDLRISMNSVTMSALPPALAELCRASLTRPGSAQVTDDILDFTATSMVLGKPALGDIKAGVITCPVLYAAEEHPSLMPIILRKFRSPGDVEYAIQCVRDSRGIERSRALARSYVDQAVACVALLPAAQTQHAELARQALLDLCAKIMDRKK